MTTAAALATGTYRVPAGGARLHVNAAGAGAPLLMVHGWAMDSRVFRPQTAGLAGHFRVITFDRRGYGLTGGEPDLARETDDIDAIADALVGAPFHLFGLSQGGRIAARYAARRPQRLRSLILQGAAIDGVSIEGPDEERIPVEEYSALAREGRMDEVRSRWLRHPMMRVGEGHADADALLGEMLSDYEGRDLLGDESGDGTQAGVLESLAGARLPLLLLTGARETEARRRVATLLRERVPGAEEVILPDSGHLGNLTEPAACNEAVRRFCARVEGRRRDSAGGTAD